MNFMAWLPSPGSGQEPGEASATISLPDPIQDGTVSLEHTLATRRSVRSFRNVPLALDDLAQLLWSAQGVTAPRPEPPPGFRWEWRGGFRTAPSAGALYPLEVYVAATAVEGLDPGLYRYVSVDHALEPVSQGDLREDLWSAALRQGAVLRAPASIVITGVVARTAAKYGERAQRYVQIEVGAVSANLYLQAQALGLGTAFIGAFQDDAVHRVLDLSADESAFGIMPVGHPAR